MKISIVKLFKFTFTIISIVVLQINVKAQNPSFATYMPLVIPGDKPDPTLTKIGNDFYYCGSSFMLSPIIHHSTDLVHWEAFAQPVSGKNIIFGSKPGEGCWGGDLVYFANKYWYFFARPRTMYFVTADKIKGPWTEPVKMIGPQQVPILGQDNSIFLDDDGSMYLVVKNGQANNWIIQLGNDGQPNGKVMDLRWLNPAPEFPYSWAEGPVMWKHDGYYYYTFAKNAGGGQTVMRSKKLVQDKSSWEIFGDLYDENNPKKSEALFTANNHTSQAVQLNDGTSWATVQSYLKSGNGEWIATGRQGIMTEIKYDKSGRPIANYPINEPMAAPKLSSNGIPWMVPHSDFFNSQSLNVEWQTLGYTPNPVYSLTDRPGWLRLFADNKQNTILKKDAEHNYSLITKIDFDAKELTSEAGLQVISGGLSTVRLFSSVNTSGEKVIKFSYEIGNVNFEVVNTIGNDLWLKLVRVNHIIAGLYSVNGFEWKQIGNTIDVSEFDKQSIAKNGWTGTNQGIYVKGAAADFGLYIYREAFTPILAGCPANQFGTSNPLSNEVLDNIHNNDWALYAGVEFGNNAYPLKVQAIEITAACKNSMGIIEVWLDSIQTGRKLVECPISSTGSLSTFRTFKANVPETTGNHDIYLRFIGKGKDKIMVLKSFRFIGKNSI